MLKLGKFIIVGLLGSSVWASGLKAELDPELKTTQSKNDKSLYLGANLGVGQAYPTVEGSPGIFFKSGFDVGFILPRGNWDRFEVGAEFFVGKASAKSSEDAGGSTSVSTNLNGGARLKVGYGYSLGYDTFLITRLNLGPAFMSLQGETSSGIEFESESVAMGLVYGLGVDIAARLANSVDLIGGLGYDRLQYDPGTVKIGGLKGDYKGDVQMNLPHIHAGIRVLL